ncbi:MAG: hypothetical protein MUC84_12470 [Solirubrobacteraceae bacterium]|nr:hypothetical protein [Solirubrobacteraceae bacterium]
MKLGVHIGYWGLGLTSEDQLEIVREAERLGYDSVAGSPARRRRSAWPPASSRCPAAPRR